MKIKNLAEETAEGNILLITEGLSYAIQVAYNDSILYQSYKEGVLIENTDKHILDINILLLLEKLGFQMDELGTYLYKDLIKEVISFIEKKEMNIDSYLNDAYSIIYRWVARDDKEMGVKTFHSLIIEAINQINTNNIDKKLFVDIFGYGNLELNYGSLAYKIAKYVNDVNIMTNSINVKNVKIKKLTNIDL